MRLCWNLFVFPTIYKHIIVSHLFVVFGVYFFRINCKRYLPLTFIHRQHSTAWRFDFLLFSNRRSLSVMFSSKIISNIHCFLLAYTWVTVSLCVFHWCKHECTKKVQQRFYHSPLFISARKFFLSCTRVHFTSLIFICCCWFWNGGVQIFLVYRLACICVDVFQLKIKKNVLRMHNVMSILNSLVSGKLCGCIYCGMTMCVLFLVSHFHLRLPWDIINALVGKSYV